jgi:DNA-binding HxlR family transcriptional regulator
MSEEQQRFDELMKKVIKVSPEELRRRLKAAKTAKEGNKRKINPAENGPNRP